jgi:hypothetical protein
LPVRALSADELKTLGRIAADTSISAARAEAQRNEARVQRTGS